MRTSSRRLRQVTAATAINVRPEYLRHALAKCTAHYHLERNHQGLDNQFIERLAGNTNASEGTVRLRERLGGLLSYYYRDAA